MALPLCDLSGWRWLDQLSCLHQLLLKPVKLGYRGWCVQRPMSAKCTSNRGAEMEEQQNGIEKVSVGNALQRDEENTV